MTKITSDKQLKDVIRNEMKNQNYIDSISEDKLINLLKIIDPNHYLNDKIENALYNDYSSIIDEIAIFLYDHVDKVKKILNDE